MSTKPSPAFNQLILDMPDPDYLQVIQNRLNMALDEGREQRVTYYANLLQALKRSFAQG